MPSLNGEGALLTRARHRLPVLSTVAVAMTIPPFPHFKSRDFPSRVTFV
jgi:hypothetical protein